MGRFLTEVGSVLSRGLNVLTGGSADVTFSARSHKDGLWTEGYIDWVFRVLRGERRHCERWFQGDLRRARVLLIEAEEIRSDGEE